ncbi:Vacuolar basic amino acid transporter 1 [Wickerhamomyces ciferrii]|uniref:Vacuolar basic amino acid transporter 1 n=1 Tax=Wickerhamomyces ciferrii (strain ATCC 14091 / BCRC 22168 / CBS 111 / JCM 3599 / NBRC 0793 / NRRL Y-1031 F-60-10) TaxID=1206466 RepID=K0K6S9_WICCF|nr:Vacuolar basic amino acid transporter 1 [Wickerhamomyces ciferrii]CCH40615.1 Vacuolar basic amino acid transporter 1 [Wickerhamomyces ciferrii]
MTENQNGSRGSTPESQLLDSDSSNLRYTTIEQENEAIKEYNLWLILPALWAGSFLAAVDGTVVANIMGPIAADFKQENLKSWIATSYLLTNTAFQPLYGKVSDIIGRKYALMFAQFTFGLGCFLSIFSQNIFQFALSRAVSGIGGGGLSAMSSIIVSDIVDTKNRGLFQGYANLNYALGQTLGAPLGAILLTSIGWRWVFGAQVPCVVFCMFMAYKNVNIGQEKPFTKENLTRIDFGGSITLVISITSFLLLLSTDLNRVILGIVFVLAAILFVYIEKYIAKEQILPSDLVKGILGICGISSFAGSFVLNGSIFGIPSFLQIVQDQSSKKSGGFLTFIVLSVSIGSLTSGFLLKRIQIEVKKLSLWISFASVTFILFGFAFIFRSIVTPEPYDSTNSWKLSLIIGLTILGFGYGSYLVSLLITVVAITGKEGQAAATGMNYLFRSIGQVLGVGLSLAIYGSEIHNKLKEILQNVDHGDYIYQHLLSDTNYLKNGKYITKELLSKLLKAYQESIITSFYPALLLAVLSVFISGGLALTYGLNRGHRFI